MQIKQNLALVSVLLSVFIFGGCQGDGDAAEDGSVLQISPASYELNSGFLGFDNCAYTDNLIVISARRADGSPLGETDLFMTLDFAENTASDNIPTLMSLYADTGTLPGVVDPNDELVSEAGDPGYSTTTNSEGIKRMIVRTEVGCVSYLGSLQVYGSGGRLFQTFDITMNVDIPPPEEGG